MNAPSSSLAPQAEGALEEALNVDGSSVFDRIALEVGVPEGAVTLRKIQILYWLRSRHPTTRPEMAWELANWRGTGRNEVVPLEASTSAPGLLDQMVKDELLWEMGAPAKRLLVSPKGIALLSRLHPACEDLDLPWRLARWAADWPAAISEVERFARSTISRQRGFGGTV
ncbi:hypothetical protein [Variovorax sp. RA8]|uniref:hypothetical protein n=1 Tax=Variovorax sp. (strain JCM 16519 / RA8) TaxID=662548 RepID=UPI0013172803|nr:hypothetical protein [Variovorax sp. RA8]VTU42323.1 hypothetical protein RA8P1_00206 [Variovorax sp. RA8]